MNVAIWHKVRSGESTERFIKGQTLSIFSVSDENTCELAYLHTCNGSLTQLQDSTNVPPKDGDIFVLHDDDPLIEPRSYEVQLDSVCSTPVFVPVTFKEKD
jgi:hypothetical protein